MGRYTFVAPSNEHLPTVLLDRCYVSGFDQHPLPSHAGIREGTLVVQCEPPIAGRVTVPYYIEGRGILMLTTATLVPSELPKILPLELVRGLLGRLKNQVDTWANCGASLPDELLDKLNKAGRRFRQAISLKQEDVARSSEIADQCLEQTLRLVDAVVDQYVQQYHQRHRVGWLATNERPVDFEWRESAEAWLAWCHLAWPEITANADRSWPQVPEIELPDNDKLVHDHAALIGPLVDLTSDNLPTALRHLAATDHSVSQICQQLTGQAIRHYHGQAAQWYVRASMRAATSLRLSETEKLQTVADIIQVIRHLDDHTPLCVLFTEPWCDFLRTGEMEVASLRFAEALARAEIGVTGFGLDLTIGSENGAMIPRDPLAFDQLLAAWSQFNLPLVLFLGWNQSAAELCPADMAMEYSHRYLNWARTFSSVEGVVWTQP
ncbi:MAG: hypothetical protein KDA87_08190 [Planctomycetales bacterium]|nr:hypothetical protein [Planctomycetales bacterium]